MRGRFPVPGLSFADAPSPTGAAPTCTLELVSAAEIRERWPEDGATRLGEEVFPGERDPARTIDFHPEAGYRLFARHFGLALVSGDGGTVACAPPGESRWRWQRFLVGRILPLAAVARGIECFHASAVTIEERALAVIGPSGAGKTSLAISMVLGGAGFLTDDVLALEPAGGGVVAHPGSAIASLRVTEEDLAAGHAGRLGEILGRDDKTYVAVDRAAPACRLGAVYFLTGSQAWQGIAPLSPPDPRLLLASTFIFSVRTSRRLANQLDVCAALAADVPMFTVPSGSGSSVAALAEAIRGHAERALGGG